MAASVKCKWFLKKCAKFLNEEELRNINEHEDENQELEMSCKGAWKSYTGENKDLILSYLESDHFLLTKQDVILESFSLPCSKACLTGVAKADNLLMSCQLQDGNIRRFRIQFDSCGGIDGVENRKQCTGMLGKYIKFFDYDDEKDKNAKRSELAKIDKCLLDKMKCRKGYSALIPKEDMKEILTLCLTDNTFPAFVAEVDELLKDIGQI